MKNANTNINYYIRFNEVHINGLMIPDQLVIRCPYARQSMYGMGLAQWSEYFKQANDTIKQLDREVKNLHILQNGEDAQKIEQKISGIFNSIHLDIQNKPDLVQALEKFNEDLLFPTLDFQQKNRSDPCIRAIFACMHNIRTLIASPTIMRWALSLNMVWENDANENGKMTASYYIGHKSHLPPTNKENVPRSKTAENYQEKSHRLSANETASDATVATTGMPEWLFHLTSVISRIGLACFTLLGLKVCKRSEVDQEKDKEEAESNIPLTSTATTKEVSGSTEFSKARQFFQNGINQTSGNNKPLLPLPRRLPVIDRTNLPHRTVRL